MPVGDTFPLVPDRVSSVSPAFSTTVSEMENGWEQRCANWKKPRRTFLLTWSMMNVSDYKIVEEFFIAKRGKLTKFYFVNTNHVYKKPSEVGYADEVKNNTYTVRFKEDNLAPDYVNKYFINLSIELIEVQ